MPNGCGLGASLAAALASLAALGAVACGEGDRAPAPAERPVISLAPPRAVSGGGTLRPLFPGYGAVTDSGIVVHTGQDGAARVGPWRLGPGPGARVVRADVPRVGALEFTATVIRP